MSALVGYKLTLRLQAIARADAKVTTVFGPELNETGVACAGGLILTWCGRFKQIGVDCDKLMPAFAPYT